MIALELWQNIMVEKIGWDGILDYDLNRRARFKFGNGRSQESKATATLFLMVGGILKRINVHVIDTEGHFVPVLLGIDALKNIGWVIDFGKGQIYTTTGENIRRDVAAIGHLVVDPRFDLITGAMLTTNVVPPSIAAVE